MGVCCSKRKHDDISDSNNNKDDEVEEDISAINKNSKLHTEAENSTKETNPTARSSSTVADIKSKPSFINKSESQNGNADAEYHNVASSNIELINRNKDKNSRKLEGDDDDEDNEVLPEPSPSKKPMSMPEPPLFPRSSILPEEPILNVKNEGINDSDTKGDSKSNNVLTLENIESSDKADNAEVSENKEKLKCIPKKEKFPVLNRNPQELEKERLLAKENPLVEKIIINLNLSNNNTEKQKECEYLIEIMFAVNNDSPDSFFTIGQTKAYTAGDNLAIKFDESFDVNYLFQRHQFVKFIIYTSDDKKIETTINLATVVFQKFATSKIPVDLVNGSNINYTGAKLPQLEISYTRTTSNLDKPVLALKCDFKYPAQNTKAKRLRYHLYCEDFSGDKIFLHKSNELTGKGALNFAIANFLENRPMFESIDIKNYIFEVYEGETLCGHTVLERNDMDMILSTKEAVPYKVAKLKSLKQEKSTLVSRQSVNLKAVPVPVKGRSKSKIILDDVDIPKTSLNKSVGFIETADPDSTFRRSSSHMQSSELNKSVDYADSRRTRSTKEAIMENSEGVYGQLSLSISIIKLKKFVDFLNGGMEITLQIAIDFTSSNKEPTKPDSLHTLNLSNNKYVKAIRSCGSNLKNYTSDQLFPVYGFGGIPKHTGMVSHCFPLNNSKKDASVQGLDEVIETYKASLKDIKLLGPTCFCPVIKTMTETVGKKLKKSNILSYHIFLILTDGKIDDMEETKEIIIESSKQPISIIIVGIGNGDFGKMNILGKLLINKLTI